MALFKDVAELLRATTPDLLIVATPTESHHAIAKEALLAGTHVLCEKPFASNLEQARSLVALAQQRGLHIAVNNQYRFMRCHAAALQYMQTEAFGKLVFLQMQQTFRSQGVDTTSWRDTDPEHTCKEFGTHVFDLCRFFMGDEPIAIRARMPRPVDYGVGDYLDLIDVEFPGERFARITLDRLTRGRHRYLDIRLDGTSATIETEIGGVLALASGINAQTRRPFVNFDFAPSARAIAYRGERREVLARDPGDLFAAATAQLLLGLFRSIADGSETPCSGADNLRSFAMMRAAYRSAREDREIDLRAEFSPDAAGF